MSWSNLGLFTKATCILTLVGVLLISFLDYFLWFDLSAGDKVTSIVSLVTAAAIIAFTAETFGLKRVQQRQFDYENRPYFRIQWSSDNNEVFQIKNEGKGIAVDITFESIVLNEGPIQTPIIIKRRPAYGVGGVSVVSIEELLEKSGHDERFNLRGYIDTKLAKQKFPELHMVYMDLLDNVYDAIFEPDEQYNDRFKIKTQEQRRKV